MSPYDRYHKGILVFFSIGALALVMLARPFVKLPSSETVSSSSQSSATGTVDTLPEVLFEVSRWKEFRSEDYGFKFRYPNEMALHGDIHRAEASYYHPLISATLETWSEKHGSTVPTPLAAFELSGAIFSEDLLSELELRDVQRFGSFQLSFFERPFAEFDNVPSPPVAFMDTIWTKNSISYRLRRYEDAWHIPGRWDLYIEQGEWFIVLRSIGSGSTRSEITRQAVEGVMSRLAETISVQ